MTQRRERSIDVQPFQPVIADAITAYLSDSTYALQMASSATAIKAKREVWSLRLELREAEKSARRECTVAPDFCCVAKSPCGTGDCRFASGDLVFLELPPVPGRAERPVPALQPKYTIETAVRPLQELRTSA